MLASKYQLPRFVKSKAHPKFLKGDTPQKTTAESLIGLLPNLVGEPKEQVEQALLEAQELSPKIGEGLVQLLINLCEFESADSKTAAEQRERVFDQAALYWKQPDPQLSTEGHRHKIAASLKGLPDQWEEDAGHLLFGDLPSNQRLKSSPEMSVQGLLDRYNLAQAQGLLVRADSIQLEVQGHENIGQLLQMLKFFGLLFEIKSQTQDQLSIYIDGPTSILETARSYGVELANFFPAIVNLKGSWNLKAPVKVAGKSGRFIFECSQNSGFRSHYPQRSQWSADRLLEVVDRFNQKYAPRLTADCTNYLLPLRNNQTLLPDLCLKSGQRKLWVQWLKYLSPAKKQWLLSTKKQLPANYRILLKGKPANHQTLVDQMAPHLVLFSSQLTAPSLKKLLDSI